MKTFGLYRRGLRHLAKRLKDGKRSAVLRTAELMSQVLPRDSIIVPMPSHIGYATVMLEVANAISALRNDVLVADILKCKPHYGMRNAKKSGQELPSITMRVDGDIPNGYKVCVIDNVYDTGNTFSAVAKVLHGAELYAIAHTER